jgi:FixJ family two-component response regulator
MDGLEIQTKVSKISAQTRVIIITGRVDPVTKNAALNAGAVAFFIKPFDDEEFLTTVAQRGHPNQLHPRERCSRRHKWILNSIPAAHENEASSRRAFSS